MNSRFLYLDDLACLFFLQLNGLKCARDDICCGYPLLVLGQIEGGKFNGQSSHLNLRAGTWFAKRD